MKTKMLNSNNFISLLFLSGLASLANAAPAPIVTSTLGNNASSSSGIGLTQSVAKRPFLGVDDQTAALPYFSYQAGQFYVEGLDVGYRIQSHYNYSTNLFVTPRFYEVKESFADNAELNGIEETKPSYFGGVSTQLNTDHAVYTFQLLTDLVESNGNEIVVQMSKSFKTSATFSLTPSLGITYQDKNLVGYYYGVDASEVATGRPQYAGDASVNVNATLNVNWNITKHFHLLGQLKYETLGSGITNSPIVDEDAVHFLTLGGVYRF